MPQFIIIPNELLYSNNKGTNAWSDNPKNNTPYPLSERIYIT